jgi:large subunit ribosomal protein L24
LKTKNPGKQKKAFYSAPIHKRRKALVAPLDKNIQKDIGKKKIAIRKGDSVKILIGQYKNKSGKVERVDYTNRKIYLKGIVYKTNKGEEKLVPFTPSNLLLTDVILDDEKRIKQKIANKKGELNGK